MFSYLDFRSYFEANGPSVKRTSTFELYPLKAYLYLLIKLPRALEREWPNLVKLLPIKYYWRPKRLALLNI